MNKFCENCGAKLNEEQDICLKCGKILNNRNNSKTNRETEVEQKEEYCAYCGNKLTTTSDYCLKCGKKIEREEEGFNPDIEVNEKPKNILMNIGIFILLIIGYLVLPQVIGILVYNGLNLSENVSMLIGNLSFMFVLMASLYKMFNEKIKDYIKNFTSYFKFTMKWWGIGLLVMYASNMIINFLIFGGDIAANEEANRAFIQNSPIIGLISIAIVAPFVEEMVFRYGVRKISGRNKYFPIVSALAFGIPHVLAGLDFANFFTFSNLLEFVYVVPYGALGYAFGMIYNKTDNILCSMTSHFLHNLMCFVIILLVA